MPEILIGVGGGVSAYKTAALVSRLAQDGHGVSVVMTEAARRFIGAATFSALTGRSVPEGSFDLAEHPLGPHIELARRADLLCIAPATADLLAKAAHGMADDLLSTLLLSFTGPVLMAPAMNTEMWSKPAVQRNVAAVGDDGVRIVSPGSGWLSCRQQGAGRMAEPDEIAAAIAAALE
ncbi:Phosphopantothenoylcysteine decarboxylase [Pseudobythopirellula maris]|uniref:Phosphopantothenoylcysteine decarboxylase n=1 Tax=Pseudobythopirellula maris TaxID=2527991 RepID=A0A5C5ZSV2_9BACT|nr:flavoprotein [Pseudobythopirellula maris]TWT90330.1 Phosphopantothenoylcysteine decarboxylase [Pseudobythopirellula maris]